ncbi:unnamed protein product [Trichobilharzia regenti]|nr:unnamed protein product [Trichobilharzia regenti]
MFQAIRRRRLEANAEEDDIGGADVNRRKNTEDLDELVDLVLDDEDDAEAAELHEIGRDQDKDDAEDEQDENDNWLWNDLSPSSKLKKLLQNPTKSGSKTTNTKDTSPDDFVQWTGDPESRQSDVDDDEQELIQENVVEQNVVSDNVISQDEFVTRLHARFSGYEFDRKNSSPKWARLTICMFDPIEGRIPIDLQTLIMRLINRSVVSSIHGIEKTIIDRSKPNQWMFRVEGINMVIV